MYIISTDEDPGLRIESFAVINLRGVSTNKTIIFYRHANIQRTLYYIHITISYITQLVNRHDNSKFLFILLDGKWPLSGKLMSE